MKEETYEIGGPTHIENAVEYLRNEYGYDTRGRAGRIVTTFDGDGTMSDAIADMQERMFMVEGIDFENQKVYFEVV